MVPIPFPPFPEIPSPITYAENANIPASTLRSDVDNAVLLLTQPPIFVGSQTGSPTPFTAAGGTAATFTSAGPGYQNSQALILTGGALPGGITGGDTYYTLNTSGNQFSLATTLGGSALTLSSSGSGTATSVQFFPSSTGISGTAATWTAVNIDTTITDPWAGHLTTSNVPIYYGMLDGYYLCEATFVPLYTGGAGNVSMGLEGQEGSGPLTTYGGQSMPNSGTSGRFPQPAIAKVLAFSVTGNYGSAGTNYVQGAVWQDSGSQTQAIITATRFPFMQVQWVSALTGTGGLPVPDNDTWPEPPTPVTSTFVNKNIRDSISFLANPPICEAYYAAGSQTIASQSSLPGTGTQVNLDTAYIDTYSAFSTSSHTWTAPVPGVYFCYGQAPVTGGSGAVSVACGLTINSDNYNDGATYTIWSPAQAASTSSSEVNCAVLSRLLRLDAGDTVALAVYQDGASSPSLQATGFWQCRLITIWRSA